MTAKLIMKDPLGPLVPALGGLFMDSAIRDHQCEEGAVDPLLAILAELVRIILEEERRETTDAA